MSNQQEATAQPVTDLEKRLLTLKKNIAEKGRAVLYIQRGRHREIVGFTVLDSESIEFVAVDGGDGYYLQRVKDDPRPVKLTVDEILEIKASDGKQEVSKEKTADNPANKKK